MKRYYIIVEGRVQGVGFRFFATQIAQRLGITGSVRNMDNGMVEIYAQGTNPQLQAFMEQVKQGDRFIRVDDMHVKMVPIKPEEKDFIYIY